MELNESQACLLVSMENSLPRCLELGSAVPHVHLQILVLLLCGMTLTERLNPGERFHIIRRIQGLVFRVGLHSGLAASQHMGRGEAWQGCGPPRGLENEDLGRPGWQWRGSLASLAAECSTQPPTPPCSTLLCSPGLWVNSFCLVFMQR